MLPESNASPPMNKLPKKRLGWTDFFIWKRGVLSIVLTKQVVLTENTSSNIKKITRTTVSFVTTYHPELSNLSNIVREHWTTIQKHPELCKIFKEPRAPVLAFRKSKSLKDILVRADISPRSAYNDQCKNDVWRAKTFNANRSSAAHIHYRRRIHHICNANCKTENIIYLLECAVYGLQYVGETKQQLSKHLNGHRSDANCKPDLPLRSTGHHDSFGKLKVTITDHNPKWDDKSRQERESFWIKKLTTLSPNGINEKK